MVHLRVPVPCPLSFFVWAAPPPRGPALLLRVVASDGRADPVSWAPGDGWRLRGVRGAPAAPLREALGEAALGLGLEVDPAVLDLVVSRLSDPASFWEALLVMEG